MTCLMCGTTRNLEQHHLVTRRVKSIRNDERNLITLCHHCHQERRCAPHMNQKAFDAWLAVMEPVKYKWMMEYRWVKHYSQLDCVGVNGCKASVEVKQ